MSNKARNTSGKFAAKSETPRKIRSVNLTDDAWQWLAEVAAQAGVSRNDYLEAMAEGSLPFMETARPQALPLIETVESDDAEIVQEPDSEASPLMETVQTGLESLKRELDEVKADRDKVFENSLTLKTKLERQVAELRSKLEREEADREEAERKLEELQENSEIDFDFAGKAGELVSWLRKEVGKGLPKQVTLKAVQKILEGKDN